MGFGGPGRSKQFTKEQGSAWCGPVPIEFLHNPSSTPLWIYPMDFRSLCIVGIHNKKVGIIFRPLLFTLRANIDFTSPCYIFLPSSRKNAQGPQTSSRWRARWMSFYFPILNLILASLSKIASDVDCFNIWFSKKFQRGLKVKLIIATKDSSHIDTCTFTQQIIAGKIISAYAKCYDSKWLSSNGWYG